MSENAQELPTALKTLLESPYQSAVQELRLLPPTDRLPTSAPPFTMVIVILGLLMGAASMGWAGKQFATYIKARSEGARIEAQAQSASQALASAMSRSTDATRNEQFLVTNEGALEEIRHTSPVCYEILRAKPKALRIVKLNVSGRGQLAKGEYNVVQEFRYNSDNQSPQKIKDELEKAYARSGIRMEGLTARVSDDAKVIVVLGRAHLSEKKETK